MRVRVSDPELVPRLIAFIGERHDTVVAQVGEHEIEVSLLGSRRQEANRLELDLRLQAWRAAHPDADAVIVD